MARPCRKYSSEMERQIVNEYLRGESARSLCEKYGFKTNKSITDKVKKYGFSVRPQREELMRGKQYESFSMTEIDSEFKAYYLGLLAADGYIVNNTVGIDLTDEDCIKFLSSSIGKIYRSYKRDEKRKDKHRLAINNPRLVAELQQHGIYPRKSKTIKGLILSESESRYLPYVIRGLIDGDGWVRKDGKEFYICTASYSMTLWIRAALQNRLYMNEVHIVKADRVWQIRTSAAYNIDILKLLAYNKPFGMERKYKLLHSEPSETIMNGLSIQEVKG